MVFIFFLLGLISAMYKSIKASTERGTLTGETVEFMDRVNTKVLTEFNL
jgi:hypothetical protein